MKQLLTVLLCLILFDCGKKDNESADPGTLSADSVNSNQADTVNRKTDEIANEDTRFKDDKSYFKLDSYLVDTKLDTADFQKIDSTCAILVSPTEEQIELMEKEYGEDLATIADDNMFYQSQAMSVLDSLGIPTITASDKRYIKLIDEDIQEWKLDMRHPGAPGWNLIFFNVRKKPRVVPAIEVTGELVQEYFDDPQDEER